LFELVVEAAEPHLAQYLLMFGAALLVTLVGVLKTFAPRLLLRLGRWQREKMGAPLGAFENLREIESQPGWRTRQVVPGLVALGFGMLLLYVLLRSLIR
jgi:hypothetical protein